jgi:hypothetical protein
MSRKAVKPRIAWEDRFAAPDADDLLAPFPKYQAAFIEQIREGMSGLGGVVESIVWHGVPWRWTFAYASEAEPERPWAYLVPQPGRPLLAMPLTAEVIAALPMKKLSRPVRDGIALAALVGGVYWPQWPLTARSQVEELILIARRRHEGMGLATA